MSWKLASTILRKRIPRWLKLLLVVLADHCFGDSLSCWPRIARLAEQCGCSERAIHWEIKKLKQLGYITVKHRQHQPAVFNLHPDKMPDLRPDTSGTSETPTAMGGRSEALPTATDGSSQLQWVAVPTAMGVSCNKEEQVLNRLEATGKQSPELFPTDDLLPPWLPRTEWSHFLEMRKKLRAPMTAYAQDLMIRSLDEFRKQGHDLQIVLQQSIKNSWKDVYPPKKPSGGSHAGKPRTDAATERAERSKQNIAEAFALAAGLDGRNARHGIEQQDQPRPATAQRVPKRIQ